jgi:hypothetical protein
VKLREEGETKAVGMRTRQDIMLLNILLSNSSFDGKTLEFNLRSPFDTVMECKKIANWGG